MVTSGGRATRARSERSRETAIVPDPMTLVSLLAPLREAGSTRYFGEPVTLRDHCLQAAFLAEQSGAPPMLVAAALLHDIGWLAGVGARFAPANEAVHAKPTNGDRVSDHGAPSSAHDRALSTARHEAPTAKSGAGEHPGRGHEQRGARRLAEFFPPSVSEPVRLHVLAKRWLCTTDPAYEARLSSASQRTLVAQGGLLDADGKTAFECEPFADDALRLRSFDDAAKVPGAATPDVDHFLPLLISLRLAAAGAAQERFAQNESAPVTTRPDDETR
jgi:gamma-butyrobetaine dioxygenase